MSWKKRSSFALLTGLLLLVSPAIYALVALVRLSRMPRPGFDDEAGLLAFYGSATPPSTCWWLTALGVSMCALTLVYMASKRSATPWSRADQPRYFGRAGLCAAAVFLAVSVVGTIIILSAAQDRDWITGVHFAFAAAVSLATFPVGTPLAFLSAFLDRDRKLFFPTLWLTLAAGLLAGAINVLYSRHYL